MTRSRRGRDEWSIFQRADGLWVASISAGYDAKGKRRRRTVYGDTKQVAREKLRLLQEDLCRGINGERLTVGIFLERWLDNNVRTAVRESTFTRYEQVVRCHLIPHLGRVQLAKLSLVHVEEMFAAMAKNGDSPRARQMAGTVLGTALKMAVKKKLVLSNVYRDVDKPKVLKKEMKTWDADQCKRFMKGARADRLWALYVLDVATGMRQGELFGLQWPDIDFEAGSLSVQRQLNELSGRLWLGPPKSAAGHRRIILPKFALDALHEHRKRMLAEGWDVKAGQVFCDSEGRFLRKSNVVRRSFLPILVEADLPRIRFHDLRHTAATLMLLMGTQPKVVAERLGHSKPDLVNSTYGHVLPTMQEEAAAKLDRLLG